MSDVSVLAALEEDECYLYALLSDPSGIDTAELLFVDRKADDNCFRLRPYQWPWYRCQDQQQAELSCRTVGKSLGIQLRAVAHVLVNPGYDMGITAPERVHLDPVIQAVEDRLLSCWLTRELLPKGRFNTSGGGTRAITHHPFLLSTVLGSRIEGRLPQRDGHGVKGMHVKWLEVDECQDYPKQGYMELIETCTGEGTIWRCIAEGQLVLTDSGWVPIEEVKIGANVLTHRGRWRPVLNVFDNGVQQCVEVRGQGHPGLVVTPEHKFYVSRIVRRKMGKRVHRTLSLPSWRPAVLSVDEQDTCRQRRWSDLHWATPIDFPGGAVVPPMQRGYRERSTNMVDTCDLRWLWLYGLYLAEGYTCDFTVEREAYKGRSYKNRNARVHWCVNNNEADEVAGVLVSLGLKPHFYRQNHSVKVIIGGRPMMRWLDEHAGRLAHHKRMAPWVLGLPREARQAIFDGLFYGDGYWEASRRRWELGVASKRLALDAKLLGQSLGYVCNIRLDSRDPDLPKSEIDGRPIRTTTLWVVQATHHDDLRRASTVRDDVLQWSPIETKAFSVGSKRVFDLEVADDHSFVLEGMVVSNCHGVVNGVGGWFYDVTKHAVETAPLRDTPKRSQTDWTIHRIVAMSRSDWNDKERQAKIEKYGSRDAPDYGRNVLGLPGPAENVIFVLHRLMKCCCDDPEQPYNTDLYLHTTIRDTDLDRENVHILDLLDLPASHKRYGKVYIGMDVGYVNDPSEILVFAETSPDPEETAWIKKEKKALPKKGEERLQLLHRVSLRNIPAPDQVEVILALVEFYRPIAFAMDRTGNGLPLYQSIIRELENKVEETRSTLAQLTLSTIKGYNFSENVLVEIDPMLREQLPPGLTAEEIAKEAGIYRKVIEVSTDELRDLVDTERLWIPYDVELIGQFNGQTFHYSKITTDLYGRRRLFSQGDFHCLDAARMAALARKQQAIDTFLGTKEEREPVLDAFFTPSGFRPSGMGMPQGHRQGSGW